LLRENQAVFAARVRRAPSSSAFDELTVAADAYARHAEIRAQISLHETTAEISPASPGQALHAVFLLTKLRFLAS